MDIQIDNSAEVGYVFPCKTATVLVSQSGTDDPELTFMFNSIGTITARRNGVGDYSLVSDGLFTAGKTLFPPFDGNAYLNMVVTNNPNIYYICMYWSDVNTIGIGLCDTSFNPVEFGSVIVGNPITIKLEVYP